MAKQKMLADKTFQFGYQPPKSYAIYYSATMHMSFTTGTASLSVIIFPSLTTHVQELQLTT